MGWLSFDGTMHGNFSWDLPDPTPYDEATEDETMTRELDGHKVNPANEQLKITVLDEPGHGGASHEYLITADMNGGADFLRVRVGFQNGPIGEAGVNGITHEALLAILIDRLASFQTGPYRCIENAQALAYLTDARDVLNSRTQRRIAEGTEGTSAMDADADAVTLPPEALP
jgi:hypothetical protein